MRVLLTGADGFIGRRVHDLLEQHGHTVTACDIADDILSPRWVARTRRETFDRCIHLAAHKYATTAEERPEEVADLNIRGTANVIRASGCPVILASTCKAADPCTVYGASKLIAERIVLNAGGVVIRLVNVIASTGSVIQIWEQTEGPLAVTECHRMWMPAWEAAEVFVRALSLGPGRYAPREPFHSSVAGMARVYFPRREQRIIPLRRGDRPVERLVAEYETSSPVDDRLIRIRDRWEAA